MKGKSFRIARRIVAVVLVLPAGLLMSTTAFSEPTEASRIYWTNPESFSISSSSPTGANRTVFPGVTNQMARPSGIAVDP